uniref:Putative secreted protein n=1 Tax=Anopheles darlingi TaxID=43151 RepID=A0A2M4DII1_ANODA
MVRARMAPDLSFFSISFFALSFRTWLLDCVRLFRTFVDPSLSTGGGHGSGVYFRLKHRREHCTRRKNRRHVVPPFVGRRSGSPLFALAIPNVPGRWH